MTMKKFANLIPLIMITFFLLIMIGCSGGGSESDVVSTSSEASGNPGVAIEATTYADASTITLLMDSGEGRGYLIIDDGALLDRNTKAKFGIRVEGGTFPVEKVLIGDGGGYQITATYNEDLKFYTCNYPVSDTDTLMPVLIQAIHPNKQASKAKYVFKTVETPAYTELIRNGLGILVGKNILASAAGANLSGLTIEALEPKAGSSTAILNAKISGLTVPLGITDLLKGNETSAVSPTLKIDPRLTGIKIIDDFISNVLLKKTLDMGIKTMQLDSMLGGMADLNDNKQPDEIAGLKLDERLLFLDINGLPGSTTDDMAALSMGLFMPYNTPEAGVSPTTFPSGVMLYSGSNSEIPFDQITRDASAIGVSLSQENMSQFVGSLLNGTVVIPALDIPTAVPNYKGVKPAVPQDFRITFNKSGVAFDFNSENPMLIINDIRIEYVENGTKALWMMSLDLAFKLVAGAHNAEIKENPYKDYESYLDIYLTLVPEYAHCAVLKDDMGIMMFDHSTTFVPSLVDGLKAMLPSDNLAKGSLELSILLGAKLGGKDGKIVGQNPDDPGDDNEDFGFGMILNDATSVSDAGRCFLTMATTETDLGKSGLCFINAANLD
jgi:hypothetical protein